MERLIPSCRRQCWPTREPSSLHPEQVCSNRQNKSHIILQSPEYEVKRIRSEVSSSSAVLSTDNYHWLTLSMGTSGEKVQYLMRGRTPPHSTHLRYTGKGERGQWTWAAEGGTGHLQGSEDLGQTTEEERWKTCIWTPGCVLLTLTELCFLHEDLREGPADPPQEGSQQHHDEALQVELGGLKGKHEEATRDQQDHEDEQGILDRGQKHGMETKKDRKWKQGEWRKTRLHTSSPLVET